MISVAHWIFATQYLEVVALLPLLLDHGQADIQKKKQRVLRIIYAVNVYFYAQLAAWAGCAFAYSRDATKTKMKIVNYIDAVNKIMPATVLIISVLVLRCRFNGR